MKTIVISVGGSVLLSKEADSLFLKKLSNLFKKISKNTKIFIIVGGGSVARRYIEIGRELNFNEKILDQIGIDVTRLNAKLLSTFLTGKDEKIPQTTDEAKNKDEPIVVMGGTTPGHSTDMVGAELSQKTNADLFIIATNVNGIYNKDPNIYHDATQIKEISIDNLIEKFGTKWEKAGKNMVIDGPALEIIKKASLLTYVVNGNQLDQLEKALTGQQFDGTKILV